MRMLIYDNLILTSLISCLYSFVDRRQNRTNSTKGMFDKFKIDNNVRKDRQAFLAKCFYFNV